MRNRDDRPQPFAPQRYRLLRLGLRAVSPMKPLLSLGLRALLNKPEQVRGRVLPMNVSLRPEQAALSREALTRLIGNADALAAMDECLCRRIGGCRDYPVDLGCLVLGEGVHAMHPKLGRPIGREQALKLMDRALDCGLTPTVLQALPDEWLWSVDHRRIVTVCFCCPCHCLVREAMGRLHNPVVLGGVKAANGLCAAVNASECMGCGHCAAACFVGAVCIQDGCAAVDPARCVACGRCAAVCPAQAIAVQADARYDADALAGEFH
jgi:hypothetical protein